MLIFGIPIGRSRPSFKTAISPEATFYAVGDIHGCFSLLQKIPDLTVESIPIVFVGDYVDRGMESASVLRWLFERQTADPENIICLMGNHERMMLDTIENPQKEGPRWLRHGGLETVVSFGIDPVLGHGTAEEWDRMRDALCEAMGPDLLTWVQQLPLSWQSGNVFVCHAGADPTQPIEYQMPETLLWGHELFGSKSREDGIWVLHGHTIFEKAQAQGGRISVDIGAYATGRLVCAHVCAQDVTFLTVGSSA